MTILSSEPSNTPWLNPTSLVTAHGARQTGCQRGWFSFKSVQHWSLDQNGPVHHWTVYSIQCLECSQAKSPVEGICGAPNGQGKLRISGNPRESSVQFLSVWRDDDLAISPVLDDLINEGWELDWNEAESILLCMYTTSVSKQTQRQSWWSYLS